MKSSVSDISVVDLAVSANFPFCREAVHLRSVMAATRRFQQESLKSFRAYAVGRRSHIVNKGFDLFIIFWVNKLVLFTLRVLVMFICKMFRSKNPRAVANLVSFERPGGYVCWIKTTAHIVPLAWNAYLPNALYTVCYIDEKSLCFIGYVA